MKIVLVSSRDSALTHSKQWGCIDNDRLFLSDSYSAGTAISPTGDESTDPSGRSGFAGLVNLIESAEDSRATSNDVKHSLFPVDALLEDYQIHAPVPAPEKIICIGRNYADHAAELGSDAPQIPVVFSKFSSALNDPDGEIVIPTISQQVDYEAELVVVIGRSGRNIPASEAMHHVFGFTCGNDVTARDWQKGRPGGQWLPGKSFDTFAPLGPCIVTTDSIPDPHNLDVILRLNETEMQHGNTSHLIFPIDQLIAHVSQFFTLRSGDLIFTGTPAGSGAGRTPPVFLKPGDRVEVEIPGIGVLKNVCR